MSGPNLATGASIDGMVVNSGAMNTHSLPDPYLTGDGVVAYLGDCLDVMAAMPVGSVDAVITDPPYGLADLKPEIVTRALAEWLSGDRSYVPDGKGFMSRDWDKFVPPPAAWDACYRVMKPGAYLLAFAAPRTADLMGISIRLAGFEIQDSLHWIFGTGFPKAKSRLKPAHEPIIMARKPAKANPPLPGLDSCKVSHVSEADLAESEGKNRHADFGSGPRRHNGVYQGMPADDRTQYDGTAGRWPPNLLLTHSAECREAETRDCAPGCPVAEMDTQSGTTKSSGGSGDKSGKTGAQTYGTYAHDRVGQNAGGLGDTGGASRFFPQLAWSPEHDLPFMYCAKAPKSERPQLADGTTWPAVKPLALICWLVRLVTPPGGMVADPFAGTGTTGQACIAEGFPCVLVEKDAVAAELIRERLNSPGQLSFDFGGPP
jgi:site-specific DNA-methyltransferase (adenine-specific)